MELIVRVLFDVYFDLVVLMGVVVVVKSCLEVYEVVVVMGILVNKVVLVGVGFASVEIDVVLFGDVIFVIIVELVMIVEFVLVDVVEGLVGKKCDVVWVVVGGYVGRYCCCYGGYVCIG